MKRKTFKRTLALVLALVLISISTTTALAVDEVIDSGAGSVSGNVDVYGTFMPLTIFVQHPIIAEYCVTPDDGGFIGTQIPVTNCTKTPISVEISQFKSAYGGTLYMNDVYPSEMDWENLSLIDSKQYIALGLQVTQLSDWNPDVNTDVYYAANMYSSYIGTLNSNCTGTFDMVASHGNAFDGQYTSLHNLVFLFTVA